MLKRGGPNNATYIVGFTILDREHVIQVGIADIGTQLTGGGTELLLPVLSAPTAQRISDCFYNNALSVAHAAVEVDGRKLWLDETVQMTNLVQTWHFPSKDGNVLNVSWERYNDYHAAPTVNFTASKALQTHTAQVDQLPDALVSQLWCRWYV